MPFMPPMRLQRRGRGGGEEGMQWSSVLLLRAGHVHAANAPAEQGARRGRGGGEEGVTEWDKLKLVDQQAVKFTLSMWKGGSTSFSLSHSCCTVHEGSGGGQEGI
eukprot:1187815-Prorocentrum_minimum.AAC.2